MDKWNRDLARIIDHTILKPGATREDIRTACREACTYRFAAVVVPPCYVPLAVAETGGKGIPVCSVVSFPFGWDTRDEKLHQAEALLHSGADEIDVVMNVSMFLSGAVEAVEKETRDITALCKGRAVVKLIVETAYLDPSQIARASRLAVDAGVDFVKTSTGFASRGAAVEDILAIKSAVGDRAGIKASGGIRSREQAESLVQAGATRLGCSASLQVISEE